MTHHEEPKSRAVQEMEAMYIGRAGGGDPKTILVLVVLAGFIWLAMHFGPDALVWLRRVVGLITLRIIVVVVTIGAGVVAYRFKKASQRWYGIIETIFGAAG